MEIAAIIDTGFTNYLTLPPRIIRKLGLERKGESRAALADGSEITFDFFDARVHWDGNVRRIRVDEADTEPLIGMTLLDGFRLTMDVRKSGKVTIKKLK